MADQAAMAIEIDRADALDYGFQLRIVDGDAIEMISILRDLEGGPDVRTEFYVRAETAGHLGAALVWISSAATRQLVRRPADTSAARAPLIERGGHPGALDPGRGGLFRVRMGVIGCVYQPL